MKKILAVLLCIMVMFTVSAQAIVEELRAERKAPAIGDVVSGFELKDISSFDLIGSDLYLYEHQSTGAQVMYLANEDTNRVFEITFRTPAETDTGVPHVFEHSTLDGSEKYPSKALFFNLIYQTYNTYMNAGTYSCMTTFPIASLSEAQLLKYADYYTDSCLNPMIYSDPSIFDEEAWRYTIDEEGNLAIEGTVYSEMQGATTRQASASHNFNKAIFPGSIAGNASGGNPDFIPDMTWEDLVSYHERYYTPSNSVTCIYGKIEDINAFLSLLDGYFSEFERTEFTFKDSGYTPISEPVEAVYDFAVEASSNTDKAATVYYGFACGELDEDELTAVDFLTTLLGDSSSALMENLKNTIPYGSFNCYIGIDGPEPCIYFIADNVNPEDAQLFKETVDASILEIIEKGFDQDAVDAIIASFKMDILLSTDDSEIGVNMIPNIMYYWATTGDLFGYMAYVDAIDLFDDYAEDGTFIRTLKEYCADNSRSALVTTRAVAGLKEEKDAALKEKLAAIQAQMSDEELEAIASRGMDEEEDDATELVRALQVVTVESLPEEIRIYDIEDEMGDDGVRRVFAECDTDGVGYATLMLNTDWIEKDALHFFKLYMDLLRELDTAEHTRSQLANLVNRYLYNLTIKSSLMTSEESDEYFPFIRISFIAMDEDMEKAYDLIGEILFESQFDAKRIADRVSSLKESLKQTINSNGLSVLLYDMLATAEPSMGYYSYVNFIDYYNFLEAVASVMEENPEIVIAGLSYIQENLRNSYKAISVFAGSRESYENFTSVADAFISTLDYTEVPEVEYEFDLMSQSKGLIVESNVNYNIMFASYEDMGLEEYTADLDAVTAIINDSYLLPQLRDQYGVYGAYTVADDDGIYMYSYRDPNIAETFQVYAELPSFMESLSELDQETLDGYILSSYSAYAMPSGELSGALNVLLNYISGKSQEKTLEHMKELKSVTPEIVAEYAKAYSALVENGYYGTAGGAAAVLSFEYFYDEIANPFGAKDNSSVVFTDITEDDFFFEAVRFAFENGFMAPTGDDTFSPKDEATLGDLAAFFYTLIGGPRIPDEAIAFLSGYEIVPSLPADTSITRAEAMEYSLYFLYAIGEDVDMVPLAEEYPDTAEIPEGYEGILGFGLDYGILTLVDGALAPNEALTREMLAYLIMML